MGTSGSIITGNYCLFWRCGDFMKFPGDEFRRILGRSGIVFFSRVSGSLMVFVTQILLARWMGAAELGVYVYAFSWCMLFSIAAGLGLPDSSIRFVTQGLAKGDINLVNGYVKRVQQIALTFSLVIVVLVMVILLMTNDVTYLDRPWVIMWAALAIPFVALTRSFKRFAHACSWFVLSYIPDMTLRPLIFLALIWGVWSMHGELSAETAMLLQLAAIVIIAFGLSSFMLPRMRRLLQGSRPRYETRQWLRVSWPFLVIVMFNQYFAEFSVVIVGLQLPPEDVALYSVCYKTALLIGFIFFAVHAAVYPKISALYAKGDIAALQVLTVNVARLNFGLALCALIVYWGLGRHILALFGDHFVGGYPMLLLIAASQLVLAAMGPVSELLSVSGNQGRSVYVFSAASILTVILNFMLIPLYGVEGAAMTVLAVMTLWAGWMHFLVVKHLKIIPSVFGSMAQRGV